MRVTLLGPRLDDRLGLGDLGQALLAPRQLLGDRHPVRHIRPIRRLRLGHQVGYLGLQLGLDLARMLIGQGAVAAGVGVDLRPVQRHSPHLQDAHLACQEQDLDEQPLDLTQKPAPERGDRVVIGVVVRRDEAERHAVVGGALQLAAREHSRRVAVNQDPQQKPRVIRRRAGSPIAPAHRPQVEPIDHLDHKPRQMSFR